MDEQQLLKSILDIAPLVRERRASAEETFGMDSAVVDELVPTGVFRMDDPEATVSPTTRLRVFEELAYADPSVAWAAVNSTSASSFTRYLDEGTRAEVMGPANRFSGLGLTPTGRAVCTSNGDYLVSGRWPVVSGCEHATSFALHCSVHGEDDDPIGLAFAFVPAADARIERTWDDVVAVKGSGSHAVTVDGSYIPESHLANVLGEPHEPSPWRPLGGFGEQSLAIAAVVTGIARGALDAAIHQARSRISAMSGMAWIDIPSVQNTIASADIAVHCQRSGLFALAEELEAELGGGELADTSRARNHSMANHCVQSARQIVSDLFATGSVDAIHQGHILEQSLRDVHAFAAQWERYRRYHYEAGRVLMGADVPDTLF